MKRKAPSSQPVIAVDASGATFTTPQLVINDTKETAQPPVDSTHQKPSILVFWESKILPFMRGAGFRVYDQVGDINIVFVAGHNVDGTPNDDAIDRWNDICLLVGMTTSGWKVLFCERATWTPGKIPTKSGNVLKRGGVACIYPGQYKAWANGFHKKAKYGDKHPALVQVAPIKYTRDFNQDFSRIGDRIYSGIIGINIHSTMEGFTRESLGSWSEGCAVIMNFARFQRLFMQIIAALADKYPIFTATFITKEQVI